jgi:hypothetical protein
MSGCIMSGFGMLKFPEESGFGRFAFASGFGIAGVSAVSSFFFEKRNPFSNRLEASEIVSRAIICPLFSRWIVLCVVINVLFKLLFIQRFINALLLFCRKRFDNV